jgi:hypothetical protein
MRSLQSMSHVKNRTATLPPGETLNLINLLLVVPYRLYVTALFYVVPVPVDDERA